MSRKDRLEKLKNKLRDDHIFNFKKELEVFLKKKNDEYTGQLQDAISEKLDSIPFRYTDFDSFLDDYKKNKPEDTAGYDDLHSRIYGE